MQNVGSSQMEGAMHERAMDDAGRLSGGGAGTDGVCGHSPDHSVLRVPLRRGINSDGFWQVELQAGLVFAF
jgi:hypothetical protein